MLDNEGYRQTLRMHNSCCFSMATVVTCARQNVTIIRTVPVLFQYRGARLVLQRSSELHISVDTDDVRV